MSNSKLIDIFLREISNNCFPINKGGNKKIKEQKFLKLRFDPKNYAPRLEQHLEIAKQMQDELGEICQNAIGTTCQNVVRALVNRYGSEMQDDRVAIDSLVKGQKGKKGAWKIVYRWLHDKKFPRWLEQENRIWQVCKAEAKWDIVEISFSEEEKVENNRKPTGSKRLYKKLLINKSLTMSIKSEQHEDYYPLLFTYTTSLEKKETRYLFYPSKAYNTNLQKIGDEFKLPHQAWSEFKDIKFNELGTEEFLGILLQKKPSSDCFDCLISDDDESFLTWNNYSLYKLLQQLKKEQIEYCFFYKNFEVVNT